MARAPVGGARAPVPVAIASGADVAARGRLLRRWLGDSPPGERWLRVGDPATFGDRTSGPDHVVLAGCACCAALPALRAGLARALRAARPDRILVDADARADLPALLDALRAPPFDALLVVDAVALVLGPSAKGPGSDPAPLSSARGRARLACADVVVGPAGVSPDWLEDQADRMGRPGWPTEWQPAWLSEDAAGGVPLDAVRAVPTRAWPQVDDAQDFPCGQSGLAVGWGPATCFDRRALVALFGRWASDRSVRSAQGVFRTERAWYACQALDGAADCTESPWRRDSRCTVVADAAFDRASALAALASAIAARDDDGP